MLWDRMAESNRYRNMIEQFPRCIRVNYAGSFHLDIIPAIPCPDSNGNPDMTLIPDRQKAVWCPSNPKGYAKWFEREANKVTVRNKAAALSEGIEPVRRPTPAHAKLPLRRAVQLLKRWRDVTFKDRPSVAPSSIALTTLAGQLYGGEAHPTEALMGILDGICLWSQRDRIHLDNPAHPEESLTDRWTDEAYEVFLDEVYEFRTAWRGIIENGTMPKIASDLEELFGAIPVKRAFAEFAQNRRDAGMNTSVETGMITPVATSRTVPNPGHHFHGK